jgi:hypothetical protein
MLVLPYHQLSHTHTLTTTKPSTNNPPNTTTMPRNGTQSDNVVDTSAGNQVHGVGEDSSIDRSGKVRLDVYTLADQK